MCVEIDVTQHRGLILKQASKFKWAIGTNLSWEDIAQEAFVAALRCRKSYDPTRTKFPTYMMHAIWTQLYKFCNERCTTVRVPVRTQKQRRARGEPQRGEFMSADLHSFDTHVHAIDGEQPDDALEALELKAMLSDLSEHLAPREREVVKGIHFDGLTMAALGEEMGVCRERVRQIHAGALDKMRARLNEKGITAP